MKTIKQSVVVQGTPEEVYNALMDSKKHSAFTGGAAKIANKEGGKFTAWDGYIEGTNIELKQGKKIVQKWRATDWPKGHYSQVTYVLAKSSKGTKITFIQTNVPDEFCDTISQGWKDYYWEPMKEYMKSNG